MASPATGTPIAGSATHIRLLAMSAEASKARRCCAAKLAGQSSCLQARADSAALAVLSDLGGDGDGQLGISSTLVAESGNGANPDCMVGGHTGTARVRFASVKRKWLGLGGRQLSHAASSCIQQQKRHDATCMRPCMAFVESWDARQSFGTSRTPPNPHCMMQ